MANRDVDIFATTSIKVPNLVPLIGRMRDESLRRAITVLHVHSIEEGEWVCNTAAARLSRDQHAKIAAPESGRVIDIIEQAIRTKVAYVFVGEIRREDDARALRAAATLGIHPIAFIVRDSRAEANNLMTMLGSWASFDMALLTEDP
jgi:hypothetical protein